MSVQTIFDIIGSISLAIIAIFICVAFYYLIKILRDISKITYQIREKGEKFGDMIATLMAVIRRTFIERKKRK